VCVKSGVSVNAPAPRGPGGWISIALVILRSRGVVVLKLGMQREQIAYAHGCERLKQTKRTGHFAHYFGTSLACLGTCSQRAS
jgi:hypothetical protein